MEVARLKDLLTSAELEWVTFQSADIKDIFISDLKAHQLKGVAEILLRNSHDFYGTCHLPKNLVSFGWEELTRRAMEKGLRIF